MPATYLLPIRRDARVPVSELTDYLREVATLCDELIVVDGSESRAFAEAHQAWGALGRHVPPDPTLSGCNGKVLGVLTGVALARNEAIVIADDDVRYDEASLRCTVAELDAADLVRPQNYFAPAPWHARWDMARTLLNRGIGSTDFPGTLAVRRSTFERMGGYSPDVLFENLELIRTVKAAGGRVTSPIDLYVRRLPPTTARFVSQRVRQAYDEFARPWRMAAFLLTLPLAYRARRADATRRILAGAVAMVALAEVGRRRGGGTAVFPVTASLWAPLWLLERSLCSWLALAARLSGGCRYSGTRITRAATPLHTLARGSRPQMATSGA